MLDDTIAAGRKRCLPDIASSLAQIADAFNNIVLELREFICDANRFSRNGQGEVYHSVSKFFERKKLRAKGLLPSPAESVKAEAKAEVPKEVVKKKPEKAPPKETAPEAPKPEVPKPEAPKEGTEPSTPES